MSKNKSFLKSRSGRKCQLSGKEASNGWGYSFLRSHFNPTAKRLFHVNLHTIKTSDENGCPIRLKVAASVLKRCPDLRLGVNTYLKRKKVKRLKGKQKREFQASLTKLSNEI